MSNPLFNKSAAGNPKTDKTSVGEFSSQILPIVKVMKETHVVSFGDVVRFKHGLHHAYDLLGRYRLTVNPLPGILSNDWRGINDFLSPQLGNERFIKVVDFQNDYVDIQFQYNFLAPESLDIELYFVDFFIQ